MSLGWLLTRNAKKGAVTARQAKQDISAFITSAARSRWLAPDVKYYTPLRVEQIIREALAGDLVSQWELFDLMERTAPRLQGNLKKLKDKVGAIDWIVQPWAAKGKQASDEAVRRAGLLDDAIWNMRPDIKADENDFTGLLFDLCDALGKGISVQEIAWEARDHDGGTLICPRASRLIQARYYGYPLDGAEDRLMLRTEALSGGDPVNYSGTFVEFPDDKFLIGIAKQKSGHPLGAALLQPLAFFWAASNFSWEFFLSLGQLFGVPIRWANYASHADPDTIAKLEGMLENMGSSAWACFPEGTTLQIVEALKTSGTNPQTELLDRVDAIYDILILGQTLTSDAGDRGTQALGKVHAEVLSDREKSVARWAANMLNSQFVPAWCRLNFGDEHEAPYFVPDIEEQGDLKGMVEVLKIAVNDLGMNVPETFAHDKLGFPVAKEGERVLGPRAAQPAAPATVKKDDPEEVAEAKAITAKDAALEKLAAAVLEEVTGVEAKWLGGAKPWFKKLITAAEDPKVSDAEFIKLIERAQAEVPTELAALLNPDAVMTAMEANMGAAAVNGYVAGYLKRNGGAK